MSSKRWYQVFKNFEIVDKIAKYYNVKVKEDGTDYGCLLADNLLWFGIDDGYWTKYQIPLCFGIDDEEDNEEDNEELIKKFNQKYNLRDTDEEFYYVPININLEDESALEEIIKKIDEAISLINEYS